MNGRDREERGSSLVETVLMVGLVGVVFALALSTVRGARSAYDAGRIRAALQDDGQRALERILSDLRRSGLTTSGAQNLPAIWERAPASDADSVRGPLVATMAYQDVDRVDEVLAYQGDGDRVLRNQDRACDELVFQLPEDQDGDGTPLDADGNLEWSAAWVCYRVVLDSSDVPWLVRVVEEAGVETSRQRIAPWVRSLTCDVVFNDRSVRFGSVAVVVYLSRPGTRGERVEMAFEGAVKLRNTSEL